MHNFKIGDKRSMIPSQRHIYLDHAAGTNLAPGVLESMLPYFGDIVGNPSSTHLFGRRLKGLLEEARFRVAQLFGVSPRGITFVSSGTEANALALHSLVYESYQRGKFELLITEGEHSSLLKQVMTFVKKKSQVLSDYPEFVVKRIPLNPSGRLSLADLKLFITKDTGLVVLQYVNNETGVYHPVDEIALYLASQDILFHVDAVQAVGLLPLDFSATSLSLAGMKIGGPAGTGLLVMRDDVPVCPLFFGGHQEHGKRAGTENLAGILGFSTALFYAFDRRPVHYDHLMQVREVFLHALYEGELAMVLNGDPLYALPHIVNISFLGIKAPALRMCLDLEGIACSFGAACVTGTWKPSHVLQAMQLPEERLVSALRFSFGMSTTLDEVKLAAQKIVYICQSWRGLTNDR